MTDKDVDALDLALALYSTPHQSHSLENRPLASGTLELIRIVAGDEVAIANAQARSARPRRTVVDAAVLYIQQALFHDMADSYRLLGVNSDANDETIKEHYRWLMRWLHPDRNPDRWVVAYSERVNRAWKSLSSTDRRRNYDQQIRDFSRNREAVARPPQTRVRIRPAGSGMIRRREPSRFRRSLPAVVLGGLSAVCAVLLYLFHVQQSGEQEALRVLAKKLALQPQGDSSAQDEAIRHRIEFEEHVIELSQPVLPVRSEKPEPAVAGARPSVLQTQVAQTNSRVPASKEPNRIVAPFVKAPLATAPTIAAPLPLPGPKAVVRPALVVASTIAIPAAQAAPVHTPASVPAIRTNPSSPGSSAGATPGVALQATSSRLVIATNGSGGEPSIKPMEKAPAAAMAPDPRPSPQEATKSVPRAFEDAYARGDLAQMMGLFAPDAVNNRGGIVAISQDYDHLFRDSGKRDLRLVDLNWVIQPDRIVGKGVFEARILHDGVSATQARGWIQIEAQLLNGHWKIHRLLHGNSQ